MRRVQDHRTVLLIFKSIILLKWWQVTTRQLYLCLCLHMHVHIGESYTRQDRACIHLPSAQQCEGLAGNQGSLGPSWHSCRVGRSIRLAQPFKQNVIVIKWLMHTYITYISFNFEIVFPKCTTSLLYLPNICFQTFVLGIHLELFRIALRAGHFAAGLEVWYYVNSQCNINEKINLTEKYFLEDLPSRCSMRACAMLLHEWNDACNAICFFHIDRM